MKKTLSFRCCFKPLSKVASIHTLTTAISVLTSRKISLEKEATGMYSKGSGKGRVLQSRDLEKGTSRQRRL